jgi:hypothetical protein
VIEMATVVDPPTQNPFGAALGGAVGGVFQRKYEQQQWNRFLDWYVENFGKGGTTPENTGISGAAQNVDISGSTGTNPMAVFGEPTQAQMSQMRVGTQNPFAVPSQDRGPRNPFAVGDRAVAARNPLAEPRNPFASSQAPIQRPAMNPMTAGLSPMMMPGMIPGQPINPMQLMMMQMMRGRR